MKWLGLTSARHLGFIISRDLSWSNRVVVSSVGPTVVAVKAMRVANCILRTISYGTISRFGRIFLVYCRPILEYCTPVWFPFRTADTDCIERIQRYHIRVAFQKCFPSPYSPDYSVRLRIFELQSLDYRWAMFDLCRCYEIVNGFCDIKFDELFSCPTVYASD